MNAVMTISPASVISLRDLADAADVLDAIGVGEAEILVQPVAHVVAVEQEGMPVHARQFLLDQIGDRRFAGAREPGEPQHRGLLVLQLGMRFARDVERLPMDVAGCGAARNAACRPRPWRW